MKKTIITVLAMLGAGAMVAQANLLADFDSGSTDTTKTMVFGNLNTTTPTVTGTGSPLVTGSALANSLLGASESFTLSFTGVTNFNGATALVENGNGTLGTYLSTLPGADLDGQADGDLGVVGGTSDNKLEINEAIYITANTDNLLNGTLELNTLSFDIGGNSDVTILLYDSLLTSATVIQANGNVVAPPSGNWGMKTDDILVIGWTTDGANPTGAVRFGSIAIDVIPEPATLGMVALFGGGILFIRRRFML